MPKVHHVKAARKAKPGYGIKKGAPYWWWKRRAPGARSGHVVYSATYPRPSQLAGSPYTSAALALEEEISDAAGRVTTADELAAFAEELRGFADQFRELGQEQSDKVENMPEGLQQSPTGELLTARAEACERLADDLETAASEAEDYDPDDGAAAETTAAEAAETALSAVSWDFE